MPTDPEQILAHVEATRQGVSALGHERDSAEQLAAATQIAYDALKTEYDAHMTTHGPTAAPPQAIYFGIYDGNPSEDPRTRIRNLLGSPAMVTYTYIINQRINVSYEIARVTEDAMGIRTPVSLIETPRASPLSNSVRPVVSQTTG